MKTLTTERCILKQITTDDIQEVYEIYSDELAMKYMQSDAINSIEQAQDLINKWKQLFTNGHGYRWGIFYKDKADKLIGTIALHYWDKKSNRIELGADLLRSQWNKGLAYEVTKAVITFAFISLEVNRLELRCDPRNIASVKIANKLSFTYEGTLRDYVYVDGKGYLDESVYSLLRKEYS